MHVVLRQSGVVLRYYIFQKHALILGRLMQVCLSPPLVVH
jgi:hypothetical protein